MKGVNGRINTLDFVLISAIHVAGRLKTIVNRENAANRVKEYIHDNKSKFEGKVLFYNWLEE